MTGRLLTARQVADWLGFCTETILRWHRDGELPGHRTHTGRLRFRESDIEEWLQGRATTARGSATHPAGRRPAATLTVATHPDREEV
jgi:excisionase family DNA binding protein